MHALANDVYPDYSLLAFSKDTNIQEAPYLYAYELYNMQLNADLVVLSACETSSGHLQRSEGIMSLARAFKYAGCPNIVTTLWPVNETSTKEIMQFFYKNLKSGMTKSKALKKAKIEFLGKGGDQSKPGFWAPFILVGNDIPIEMAVPSSYLFKIIPIALVCILLFLLYYIQRKKTGKLVTF